MMYINGHLQSFVIHCIHGCDYPPKERMSERKVLPVTYRSVKPIGHITQPRDSKVNRVGLRNLQLRKML